MGDIGMDFSELQRRRYGERLAGATEGAEVFGDEDVQAILEWYYGSCAPSCVNLLKADHAARFRQGADESVLGSGQRDLLQRFRSDGFLKFEDFGVNVASLHARSLEVLRDSAPDRVTAKAVQLSGLEPVLENQELLQLASFYLGSDVEITGYKLLRVGDKVTPKVYISGYWHHDNCGSRLKLFIFLQDVHKDGGPTLIAKGSQRTAFYAYGNLYMSRFSDGFVSRAGFEVEPMLGGKGGGFLFDTNTVHKGQVEEMHLQRDAVVLEIQSLDKARRVIPDKGTGACPEPGTHPVGKRFSLPRR